MTNHSKESDEKLLRDHGGAATLDELRRHGGDLTPSERRLLDALQAAERRLEAAVTLEQRAEVLATGRRGIARVRAALNAREDRDSAHLEPRR